MGDVVRLKSSGGARSVGFNPPKTKAAGSDRARAAGGRVWTINGDFTGLAANGVARYAREVTEALDRLALERHPSTRGISFKLVTPRAHDLPLTSIATVVVPEFNRPRLPQVWAQVQLPRHTEGGLLSFCNLAPVAVTRQIVCIHDLHTRMMPESYGLGFRLAHRIILPILGRRVKAVTTVSSLSKQHLSKYGIAPPEKTHITYNGADHARRWQPNLSAIARPRRPYVFGLARDQAYKNTELFWKIAGRLDAAGIDIVLAGAFGAEASARLGVTPANVSLLGRVSDDDLAALLSGAICFAFPSRIEGFGIPAVEAMTWNCPVVAASAPCLPEVCGEAAVYVDPDDVEGWADAIVRLGDDMGLRQTLVARGQVRAQDFSWRAIALTYLKLMAEIDGVLPAAAR